MQKLYKFYWDVGRSGSLDGLFFADEDAVNNLIGKEIYFGEVLGKQSEVYGVLGKDDVVVVDIPQEAVDILVGALGGGTISGFNPLDYYEDESDDEEEE